MSKTLRDLKAKGRAENKKTNLNVPNVESVFFRQLKEVSLHPRIIKQARKSGILNLSNRGIAEMPDIVWNITCLTAEETKALSISLETNDEDKWWDYVDLTKLVLASNALKSVSPEISNYKKLVTLDLHDNCLTDLPSTMEELLSLNKLNLSRNKFESLPESIYSLKSLKVLQVQHNKLKFLSDDIGNLSFLEELDMSNNYLKQLPNCIGFLSRVIQFNISNNELSCLPVEIGDMIALKHLDLSNNNLKSLPSLMDMLRHLEQLYIQHNYITDLPILSNCAALKEIHAGFNEIQCLAPEFIETIPGIKILDLRDNKITEVPDVICSLQSMERLDISNNNLSNLPYTLGTLPHLKFLAIEGNPMRSIRRDIIQRGTVQLLRWLRSRIENPSVIPTTSQKSSSEVDGSCNIDKYALKASKTLPMSNKSLSIIPQDLIVDASAADVTMVDFSKNNIHELPEYMAFIIPKLTELNLGFNKLSFIPAFLGSGEHLTYLDIRNNSLQSLPDELSNLSHLREINICSNKFCALPACLYKLQNLEIILASDNKIELLDVLGLSNLKSLAVLDLHNNSIRVVPPQLGNMKQLRSLVLHGNLFRNIRPAILSKGTAELLQFLRDRIPLS